MAYYDKELILSELTGFDIVEILGLDYEKRAGKTWISCPGHITQLGKEDTHKTNCNVTNKGYYCHACKSGANNIIDMTMECTGNTFYQTLELLSQAIGGAEIKETERKKWHRFPLKAEELQLLGLSPVKKKQCYFPISSHPERTETNDKKVVSFGEQEDVVTYISYQKETAGILELYQEDKSEFWDLIHQKWWEQVETITAFIDTMKQSSSAFFGPFLYEEEKKLRSLLKLRVKMNKYEAAK